MTTTILIFCFIILLIFYFGKSNKEKVDYAKETELILKAHRELDYPKLDTQTQFEIIKNNDLTPIGNITPEITKNIIPNDLLKHYITIDKSDFEKKLLESDFIESVKIENAPNPKHDGIWWNGEKIIEQERGVIFKSWIANSNESAIKIFSELLWKDRLG